MSTFRELRELYRLGVRDFEGSELDEDPDDDLRGICLDGVDLSKSLVVASFCGARLRAARFRQSNVKTCDFRNADLTDADFSSAALCATQFLGSRMEGTDFTGAAYHSHVLKAGERPHW